MPKIILVIFGVIIILYIIVCLYLYFNQENILFLPRPLSKSTTQILNKFKENIEPLEIVSTDGVLLKGWLINKSPETKNFIIFFGGNNQEVSSMIAEASTWKEWITVLVNYRGYGDSEGVPSEQNFYTDAEKIYDTLQPKGKVVLIGRSLGTGVATYLTTKRKTDGIILVTPYDSMTSVAQEKYPLIPIKFVLKHTFDSISRTPEIKTPVLSLVASDDDIVPPWHAKALLEKWGGLKIEIIIKGVNHNSIVRSQDYIREVTKFLESIK